MSDIEYFKVTFDVKDLDGNSSTISYELKSNVMYLDRNIHIGETTLILVGTLAKPNK